MRRRTLIGLGASAALVVAVVLTAAVALPAAGRPVGSGSTDPSAVAAASPTLPVAAAPSVTAAPSLTAAPSTEPTASAELTPFEMPSASLSPVPSPDESPAGIAPTVAPSAPPIVDLPAAGREVRVLAGTEPDVAADPNTPGLVAVLSQNVSTTGCGRPAIAISGDGGSTWRPPSLPWRGCQDKHAVIAWGPAYGPARFDRLWAANAVSVTGGMALSVTYSDDLGRTWSIPFVSHYTPPWSGCFPSIAVDNNPASPDFGTVYVAYNWLASPSSVGVSVLASRDGAHWSHAEVPVSPMAGYPYAWRFGYRILAAPEGGAYVSFYEGDMRHWSAADMWDMGAPSNTGRSGYAIARVLTTPALHAETPRWIASVGVSTSPVFDPECQSELALGPDGALWFVLGDRPASGGVVKLGHSDDDGATWTWTDFRVGGGESFKPSATAAEGGVFVAWHAMDSKGMVTTYYSISTDEGKTFSSPTSIAAAPFHMPAIMNGTGLREAAVTAGGIVYYAWGDNRSGLAIYLFVVRL